MAERLVTEFRITNYVHFIREHPIMLCHRSSTFLVPLEILSRGLCDKIQIDALFIFSLFRQSASTCFGHIYPLHVSDIFVARRQEVYCILVYTTFGRCCAFQLNACSIPTRPTDSQLKNTTRTNCCIYVVCLKRSVNGPISQRQHGPGAPACTWLSRDTSRSAT
jgi:hypothetical protein